MTKEEALYMLKHLYSLDSNNPDVVYAYSKAFGMAIEALEQELCEDAISREDVLMCMTGEYLADREYTVEDIISQHIKRIKALPSVTPKQRTGHWIEDEYEMLVWCSVCGEDNDECSNYCPDCGAKMEE